MKNPVRNLFAVVAACVAALTASAGTYTYKGSGSSFSDAFAEGVPPVGDSSVVLDFSGATANVTLANDLTGLFVTRLVAPTASGVTLALSGNAITFAASDGAEALIDFRETVTISAPVVLSANLTICGRVEKQITLSGTVSGPGRILAMTDREACTTATYNPMSLELRSANTFSGGISIVGAICSLRCTDAAGTGPLLQTNTFTLVTAGGKTLYNRFNAYPPQTITNKIHLVEEKWSNYTPAFVLANNGVAGDVILTTSIWSRNSKLANYGSSGNTLRIRGGFDAGGSDSIYLEASSGPVYIETTPIDAPNRDVWGCTSENPVVFSVTGNRVRSLCGYGGGKIRFDIDNAFLNRPAFAPQPSGTQWMQLDLNGTTQVLGGHDKDGSGDPYFRTMLIANSSSTRATLTITQETKDNNTSPLTFSGAIDLIKDGAKTLILTNAASLPGALTVRAGTFGISRAPAETALGGEMVREGDTVKAYPSLTGAYLADAVTLEGGTFNLNGIDWITRTLTITGGQLENGGSLAASTRTCAISGGTILADIAKTDLVKAGSGSALLSTAPTGRNATGAEYALPSGTIAFYAFDTAETLAADYLAGGKALVTENGKVTWSADGAARGCAVFDGTSNFKLPEMPAYLLATNSYTISWWEKFDFASVGQNLYNGNTEYSMLGFGDYTGSDAGNNQHWACFTIKNKGKQGEVFTDDNIYSNAKFNTYGGARYTEIPGTKETWNAITNGAWHLMTLTCQLGDNATTATRTWYLDGTKMSQDSGSYSYTVPLATNPQFYFGRGMWGAKFYGSMDELIILDHAATATEVQAFYEAKSFAYTPSEDRASEIAVEAGTLNVHGDVTCIYHFDDATSLGKDSSPNAIHLVANGTVAYADGVSPFATGGSLYLAGSAYLKASAYAAQLPTGKAPFTFGCFIRYDQSKSTEYTGKEHGWMHLGTTGKYKGISMSRGSAGSGNMYWNDFNLYPALTKLDDGSWHHAVTTWDGITLRFYLDGTCTESAEATASQLEGLNLTAGNFYIGKAMNGQAFIGWIDEAAVFNKALTSDEIATWRTSGLGGIGNVTLNAETVLTVASGAAINFARQNETVDTCACAGTLTADTLTVTNVCNLTGTINANLVWADGVTVVAPGATPAAVSGTVTLLGGGTLQLDAQPAEGCADYLLATGVTGLSGAAHFANWAFVWPTGSAPSGFARRLILRENGNLIARLGHRGFELILR